MHVALHACMPHMHAAHAKRHCRPAPLPPPLPPPPPPPTAAVGSSPAPGRFLKGAYALYVPDWLSAFGRRRLLLLRAEDYWADPAPALRQVSDFLGVRALPRAELEAIAARPITYLPGSNATFAADRRVSNRIRRAPPQSAARGHVLTRVPWPMPAEAAELLSGFYAPLNAELAALMDDERFLWRDAGPI